MPQITLPAQESTIKTLIQKAYWDTGLLQESDEPNELQYAVALQRLNDIVSAAQTQGLKLFLLEDIRIPMVAGRGEYILGHNLTKPYTRIIHGYYVQLARGHLEDKGSGPTDGTVTDSSSLGGQRREDREWPFDVRRPLIELSWEEWGRLSTHRQQGQVNSYFVDKQTHELKIHLWLVPDEYAVRHGDVYMVAQRQMPRYATIDQHMKFPIEWTMYLRWALADDLASGQPPVIQQRCAQRAESYRQALENWDREDAPLTFSPDPRAIKPSRFL